MTWKMVALCAIAGGLYGESKVNLEVTSPLGAKFYSLPDPKGSVEAAQKASDADPKNTALLLKLALAQAAVWQYQEAVATCTRGIALAPDNADFYTERGHREVALRKFAAAEKDLQKAVTLDPKKVDGYYHLGLSHYFQGHFAEAAQAFSHAVELAPNQENRVNSTNWYYASLRRAGKKAEAAKALEAVPADAKSSEGHTQFYFHLVRFFQGRMKEADVVPAKPVRGEADVEPELQFDTVAYGVGNWHLYNGETAKAQEYFREIVKGKVWVTWGFIGAEREVARAK